MKLRITLFLLLVPLWSVLAYDYGFNLSDATALSGGKELLANQSNKGELWFETALGEARFRTELVYDFAASWSPSRSTLSPYRLDVGRFDVAGISRWGELGTTDWDLGRIAMADLSGLVVAGKADGLQASLYRGTLKFTTQAFYTGLVVKKNSRISVTDQDRADAVDDSIALAPRRAVYSLGLGLKELFWRQDLELEAMGSTDLREKASEGRNAYYSTVRLSGPLLPLTRYKLGGVGEVLTSSAERTWAAAAFTEVTTNLPWQSAKLTLEATASSGFVPLGAKPLSQVSPSVAVGDAASLVADLSFRPAPRLTLGARPGSFFDTTGSTDYLGSEVQTYFTWKLASELSLAGNAGVFLPPGAAAKSASHPVFSVAVSATASL